MSPDTSAPPTRRPDTRQPGPRRLLAGATLVGAAAVWWAGAGTGEEVETLRPAAGVTAVEIDLTAGAISLEAGERLLVEVAHRSGPFARTPAITSAVTDGVLQVTGTCPRLGIGRCATDVIVTLPPVATVEVATGAGSIEGLVTGGSIRASTEAGPVTLTATDDIDEMSVSTGAGSIDLTVPELTYAVTTHTGVGPTRIDVDTAADAHRTIEARSGAGSVTVRTADDVQAQRETPTSPSEPATTSASAEVAVAEPTPTKLDPPQTVGSLLDETMADHLERFGIAGASVTIVEDGEVVVSKGYGYADVEAGTPVDAETTVFPAASVTKLFTWTAIMQLVERGLLDLDAEVNDYLEAFQVPDEFAEPIRVRHLLSHTTGFEDKPMSLAVVPEELVDLETALIRDVPSQDREPGRLTAYNNYGAGLAGYLVAETSGMSWEDHLDRHILEPLDMTRTSGRQPTPDGLPDGMTKVYRSHDGELIEADQEIVALAPFGGMVTTSQDMASFMLAHLQDGRAGERRILQEATARQMHHQLFTHDPRLAGNAHGFWESTEKGQRVLSHLGDHNSSMTGLWLLPEHDLGIYVAYNSDRGGEARAELWDAFLDHTFPDDQTPRAEPVAVSSADLERFEGTYGISRISSTTPGKLFLLLGAMTVSAEDGDLITRVAGYEPTRWIATGDDAFVSADGRSRMVGRDEAGQPTHLSFDGPSTGIYSPLSAWVATPWNDRAWLHGGLLVVSSALIVSALVLWPAMAFLRRRRGSGGTDGGSVARWWAGVTGGLYLLFIVLLVASLLDILALEFGASPTLMAALTAGLAAAVLTLGALTHTILAWRRGHWSVAGRVHYTLVTVAFVALTWQLSHWNLLGFHA